LGARALGGDEPGDGDRDMDGGIWGTDGRMTTGGTEIDAIEVVVCVEAIRAAALMTAETTEPISWGAVETTGAVVPRTVETTEPTRFVTAETTGAAAATAEPTN
jgi:hypothetical protein